jgi:tripartite-type tricarboxylate transporter receptor subunit TctC
MQSACSKAGLLLAFIAGAHCALAQEFPSKPIRIYTSDPGAGNDLSSRLVAQGISAPLGQPVVVENRAAIVAIDTVAKAAPDGYSLVVQGSNLWIQPLLQPTSYDLNVDFAPVSLLITQPCVLAVHPSLPVKSVAELVSLAKARPAELNYSSAVAGGTTHLSGELFKALAHVNIMRIPYKGNGPALNAVIGGEVQVMFPTGAAAAPPIKARKLRALAVTTAQPSALFPGIVTVAATVPGYEAASMIAMYAPGKTPSAIINRLSQEIARYTARPEVKEKFLGIGFEAVGSTPDELAVKVKSEIARLGKVIRESNIKSD